MGIVAGWLAAALPGPARGNDEALGRDGAALTWTDFRSDGTYKMKFKIKF